MRPQTLRTARDLDRLVQPLANVELLHQHDEDYQQRCGDDHAPYASECGEDELRHDQDAWRNRHGVLVDQRVIRLDSMSCATRYTPKAHSAIKGPIPRASNKPGMAATIGPMLHRPVLGTLEHALAPRSPFEPGGHALRRAGR